MTGVGQDLRYGLRTLARTPGFSVTVILTLALGIGANTSVFSILDAVLLRPLPYRDSSHMVAIWERSTAATGVSKLFAPYSDLEAFRKTTKSFDRMAGATWATGPRILTGRGPARNVLAIPASPDLFSLLGVAPAMGRTFQRSDLQRGCTVVLAHAFWQSVLGSPRNIPGQQLTLDDQACEVIGVMPASFAFYPAPTQLWTLITPASEMARDLVHYHGIGIFAHLRPGLTTATAQAELIRLHRQIHGHERHGAEMEPLVLPLQDEFTWMSGRNLRLTLLVLFAAVNFVLLIGCVNVANLLLGRALIRGRELAIRAALGSGRRRLMRQLLTEGAMLSVAAATLGTGLAALAVHYFRVANPIELPPGTIAEVNVPVLAWTVFVGAATTVLFALAPARKASRADINEGLKTGGRAASGDAWSHRLGKALVVFEVMLSLELLAGAGLLIESVARFSSEPLGFTPAGLLTMNLALPKTSYPTDARRLAFLERAAASLGSLPGVRNFAFSTVLPLRGIPGVSVLSVEGRPDPPPDKALYSVGESAVSPSYFRVMGIPLLRGRAFEALDNSGGEPGPPVLWKGGSTWQTYPCAGE